MSKEGSPRISEILLSLRRKSRKKRLRKSYFAMTRVLEFPYWSCPHVAGQSPLSATCTSPESASLQDCVLSLTASPVSTARVRL